MPDPISGRMNRKQFERHVSDTERILGPLLENNPFYERMLLRLEILSLPLENWYDHILKWLVLE